MIHLSQLKIDKPLSRFLGSVEWETSILGKIARQTNNASYLEREPEYYTKPSAVWRVVHAFWNPEDEIMTRFRAYGIEGEQLPYTNFGIHYDSIPPDRHDVTGRYNFKPKFGNQYILAIDNRFTTVKGGYALQVLDEKYPSETFVFSLSAHGKQHMCLIIGFRLLKNLKEE